MKKEILTDIIEAINLGGELSYRFRDNFLHDRAEEIVNHGYYMISEEELKSYKKKALRVLSRGIHSMEDAQTIEGVVAYGEMNGYESILRVSGLNKPFTGFTTGGDIIFAKEL